MAFECGGESVEARGPFLSSASPINTEGMAFTATLSANAALQALDEYEGPNGEKLKAIPEAKRGSHEWVTTGVTSTFTIHSSVPGEIRAISSEEIEATEREEARQREQAQREAEAKKHQEEAAAKKRHEEDEAAAAKRHEEEVAAAAKHHEEELAAQAKLEEETARALNAAISKVLAPKGAATSISTLLKHGGVTLTFTSPELGT